MSLLKRRSSPPGHAGREERSAPFEVAFLNPDTTGTYANIDVSPDAALRLSAVWACVRLLSDTVSTLPVDVYRRGSDSRTPLTTPPLLISPAAGWPVSDWLYQVMVSLLLRGNAYGVVTARGGASMLPTQVELVHPDVVTVQRLTDGTIEYRFGGQVIDRADVFHVRAFPMPGMLVGLSPIAYARQAVGLGLAVERFGAQFFGGNATPSALLIGKQAMTPEAAQALKDRWRAAHEGRRDLAVLTGEIEFKPLTIAPNESQFVETQRLNVATIARYFGLPPEMIGGEAGGSLTYANVEQRSLDFLTYAVGPWVTRIESALTALLPRGQVVKLNTGALLKTDLKSRYEAHEIGLRAGFLTIPEVREIEDLPPLPDQPNPPPDPAPTPEPRSAHTPVTVIVEAAQQRTITKDVETDEDGRIVRITERAEERYMLTRCYQARELRADGRTLVGLAVPYNVPTTIGTYRETFARGAFPNAVNDPASVKLMAAHAHESLPIGRAITLTDTDAGLEAELRVSDTMAGRDVLALVRDGVATGLSVGFLPIEDQWSDDRTSVVRTRAALLEVSVVAWPAYDDARIASLRTAEPQGTPTYPRLLVARLRLP